MLQKLQTLNHLQQTIRQAASQGQPLIILVHAPWCPSSPEALSSFAHERLPCPVVRATAEVEEAHAVADYLDVRLLPSFFVILPERHPTLTLPELEFSGSHGWVSWATGICKRWVQGDLRR